MNQKKLVILGVALIALLAIFFKTQSSDSSGGVSAHDLFGDINPQKIYKIKVEKGEASTEVELHGDSWIVPSKAGFPADDSKIRALLVKLLDLSVSQEVTRNPAKFESLGVGDDIKKSGKGKVSFYDNTGALISGVLVGDQRKKLKENDFAATVGLYLRRLDQPTVFLIQQSLTFDPAVTNWLNLDVVNILQSRIISVAQFKTEAGAEKTVFELEEAADSAANPREFVLKGDLPAGQILDTSAIGLVRSGLENNRAIDVFSVEDPVLKDLNFDQRTLYRVNNGLEYQLISAEKDGKAYGRISVIFNPATARVITEAAEKKEAERKAEEAKTAAASSSSSSGAAESSSSSAAPAAPKPDISSQEEADKLNSQFSKWVYEIPQFNSKKYRSTREQLLKKPEPPPPPAGPAAKKNGGPSSLSDLVSGITGSPDSR